MNILIIDDNPDLAETFRGILRQENFNSDIAGTASEAIELCKHKTYDLAFIDIKLPDTNGIELLQKLAEKYSDLEFLIMTAYGTVETVAKLVGQKGVIGYELKPLNMNRIITLVHQVKSRRLALKALINSEKRYKHLVETMKEGIIIIDENGMIIYVNPGLCRMTGFRGYDLMGIEGCDLVHEDERESCDQALKKKSQALEVRIKSANKNYINTILSTNIKLNNHGEFDGCFAVITDITEKVQAEQALEESENKLHELSKRLLYSQEHERAAISRDLHDELGQRLTSLAFEISYLKNQEIITPDRIEVLSEMVNDINRELHSINKGLRPVVLDRLGLTYALESVIDDFRSQQTFEILSDLHIIEKNALDNDMAMCIFRVFQESLNNAAKHSQADTVLVKLEIVDESIRLRVKDNGIGFDTNNPEETTRFGLLGMKERCELYNSKLQIKSSPGNGVEITAEFPLGEKVQK